LDLVIVLVAAVFVLIIMRRFQQLGSHNKTEE